MQLLLIGDSGVGKSCLLTRFTQDFFSDQTASTIGVDFKTKSLAIGGKQCKLTIWDTAGQERFRTLTSSYYRGAQGIIFVYDSTSRDSFEDLEAVWMKEVELYSNVEGAVNMVVANKKDLVHLRQVTVEEGHEFARRNGALFVETSAKTNDAVIQAFEELVSKILDSPQLIATCSSKPALAGGSVKLNEGQGPSSAPPCAC